MDESMPREQITREQRYKCLLDLIASGATHKQAANQLGITEVDVKHYLNDGVKQFPTTLTERERKNALLNIIPGPLYVDACQHGGYLCSFRYLVIDRNDMSPVKSKEADLYVINDDDGKLFCIRCSAHPADYRSSPGGVVDILRFASRELDGEMYPNILRILLDAGRIEWLSNKEQITELA